jgi:hypothetical protein
MIGPPRSLPVGFSFDYAPMEFEFLSKNSKNSQPETTPGRALVTDPPSFAAPNMLRFDFGPGGPGVVASTTCDIIRESVFEKAQLTRDYHWRCVVDRRADLSSAVTSQRGAAISRQS